MISMDIDFVWGYNMRKFAILKRIRYWTMNSWNECSSLAYNMKVYNLTEDSKIKEKLYELLDEEKGFDLFNTINSLIENFNRLNNYEWQAGFNGRSGGYLVLYKGGKDGDRIQTHPGLNIKEDEVPGEVKRKFRSLALSIQKAAILEELEMVEE